MSAAISRRGFFSALSQPFKKMAAVPSRCGAVIPPAVPVESSAGQNVTAVDAPPRTAIIQGRFCLALTSFCSVCSERCPVPGAITAERGLPMVVADLCTGCGVCQDVCPAPRNAVLMLPRRAPAPPAAVPA